MNVSGRIRRLFSSIAFAAIAAATLVACGPVSAPHSAKTLGAGVPHLIIDTDLSLYWDDVTALGMANVLEQRGKDVILGVVSDIRNTEAAAAIDAIDTAYGHASVPVGAVADSGADTVPDGYDTTVIKKLPHLIHTSAQAQGAVSLYRRLLAHQPDHSVTIVALGAYTNLAGLLRSKPGEGSSLGGRRLVAAKVKRLVIEDGLFPGGAPVAFTNTKYDIPSARYVVDGAGWPTPVAWVDGFVGLKTQVGGDLCTSTPARNPMRVVYEALFGCGPPKDGDWDGPMMLYAIGGTQGVFDVLGRGGTAVMNSQGGLSWRTVSTRPDDVYVHVTDQQELNARIDALLESR